MGRLPLSLILLLLWSGVAAAQTKLAPAAGESTETAAGKSAETAAGESAETAAIELPERKPPKPPEPKSDKLPGARELFASVPVAAPLAARAIGFYSKGCLAGGVALPLNGPDWQVMRVSRNRNWGSPQLVDYLERLASDARAFDGWPGLLVGDMSQPRGGPMITGHTSHQVGLDADIWLTSMPDRTLTVQEREDMTAVSMLKDPLHVDPKKFTDLQIKLIRRAASYPQVARIFVHPAIKRSLCARAGVAGKDTSWLAKVRPWWNHHYHFHVRLACPPGMEGCENQKPVTGDLGCGKELDDWDAMLKKSAIWMTQQNIDPNAKPGRKKKPFPLKDLPDDCRTVLTSGGNDLLSVDDELPPVAVRAIASKEAGPGVPLLSKTQLQNLLSGGKISIPMPDRNPVR
jgi:penicillin-insensitive murein endopeptidase